MSEFVTLDGVMEAPGGEPSHPHTGWVIPFAGEEQEAYKLQEVLAAESLLLGRTTYEGFAAAWPTYDGVFADKMNAMPKHVVSSTLTDPVWNSEVLTGPVVEAVSALKDGPGGPILVAGSAMLVHALIPAGLVDELRLMVFPVILGSGIRWYPESPTRVACSSRPSSVPDRVVVPSTRRPLPARLRTISGVRAGALAAVAPRAGAVEHDVARSSPTIRSHRECLGAVLEAPAAVPPVAKRSDGVSRRGSR